MTPDFWLQRWQENRIGFHQSQINTHLETHWPTLGAAPGGTVFVPLCGKSLDMLWLAGQGYRVRGVELSEIAVQSFFTENGLTPDIEPSGAFMRYRHGEIEILCGDLFDLRPADLADVTAVYDRASLIALPPEMRGRYAQHKRALLPDRPPVLLVTLDYPQTERQGPPFAVSDAEVRNLYADAWTVERVASVDLRTAGQHTDLSRFEEHVFILRSQQPRT
ncbi:thiopurine S-methyltransferase [Acidihalobacter ferrooxydans]|uniref:Thiopurine S-methyltransferase n=1 Tax=Acidihalobacter ferrooxydans TaxID=1765967 RepID=A0A1P8UK78_9GAMM|nr:thiopurine S-methyltransferase [Acidihalobacter ferrooxydans]APZ44204.1 thiopurine S-methyltransferase [Acidihalobacter ferrooxydans]